MMAGALEGFLQWGASLAAAPVLPGLVALKWAQPLFWGVVLAAGVVRVLSNQSAMTRRAAMAGALIWGCWPGMLSPTWWLGLAFQLPSWVTLLLCADYLFRSWQSAAATPAPAVASVSASTEGIHWLAALGLFLGALLLADMFIWLPFSLYRWGFGSVAFGVLLAFVVLIWALAQTAAHRRHALFVISALALYTLTRLPSGNVFDAVMDPWLWFVILGVSARRLWRTMVASGPLRAMR